MVAQTRSIGQNKKLGVRRHSYSLFLLVLQTLSVRSGCEHGGAVNKVVWVKDSPCFLSAGEEGIVRLWDVRTGAAPSPPGRVAACPTQTSCGSARK